MCVHALCVWVCVKSSECPFSPPLILFQLPFFHWVCVAYGLVPLCLVCIFALKRFRSCCNVWLMKHFPSPWLTGVKGLLGHSGVDRQVGKIKKTEMTTYLNFNFKRKAATTQNLSAVLFSVSSPL